MTNKCLNIFPMIFLEIEGLPLLQNKNKTLALKTRTRWRQPILHHTKYHALVYARASQVHHCPKLVHCDPNHEKTIGKS